MKKDHTSTPQIQSLNYDASAFTQQNIATAGQTPAGVAARLSHVIKSSSRPQSQQNIGTKALISELPGKTQVKLHTGVVHSGISCLERKRHSLSDCSKNLNMLRSDRSAHNVTVL